MDEDAFKKWFAAYGNAWTTRSVDAWANLVTEDCLWLTAPFDEPLKGRSALRQAAVYWVANFKDIEYTFDLVAVSGSIGVAHTHGIYTDLEQPGEKRLEVDTIAVAKLNDNGLCQDYRHWWKLKP
jgi:uncharacterized protein (TIGR02246 family)